MTMTGLEPPVAVLQYRYWERRFGLDLAVLGRQSRSTRFRSPSCRYYAEGVFGTENMESPDIFMPLAAQVRSVVRHIGHRSGGFG
jgi:hypothetical protein